MSISSAKYNGEYNDVRPINDLRELIRGSVDLYEDKAAFLVKTRTGGPYEPITYARVRIDMNAFGTALVELGYKGKKIAVIGENRYEWALTYFTVAC